MTTLPPWLLPVWQSLLRSLDQRRLHHALLVTGPAGLGKRQLAGALIDAALCIGRSPGEGACGLCRSCVLLAAGSHPDRVHVTLELRDDGKLRSEILIDQIRALSQRFALASQFGGLQLALVEPAELMNTSAANGLLKTLEEPTPASVIVLVSDDASRLPATIRSRCQRIGVVMPDREQALCWLHEQGVASDAAASALVLAQGNPGAALALASGDGHALHGQCQRDLAALARGRKSALAIAGEWSQDRPALRVWLAAIAAQDEARRLGRGENGSFGLTGHTEIQKLATWFGHANEVRRLLDTPLRSDLLLFHLLRDWPTTNRDLQ